MSDETEPQPHPDLGDNAGAAMAEFIEKIESLEEEKAALVENIKSVYAAAAGDGFDKKAVKQIIKDRKADLDKTLDLRAIVDTYVRSLANRQGMLGDWARTWRTRRAKTDIDQAKPNYADPKLDEFLQKRKAEGGDGAKGEQP